VTSDTLNLLQRLASLSKDAGPEKAAVNDVIGALLKLYEVVGRAANIDEAIELIEEARLG
jgi:hypothetical protein